MRLEFLCDKKEDKLLHSLSFVYDPAQIFCFHSHSVELDLEKAKMMWATSMAELSPCVCLDFELFLHVNSQIQKWENGCEDENLRHEISDHLKAENSHFYQQDAFFLNRIFLLEIHKRI